MRHFRSSALLAVLCLVALPAAARAQSRSEEALARRVDSLARRVVELENRIAQLESARPQQGVSKTPAIVLSNDLANWRRLREDMSYDEVRRILGEPARIDGGIIANWFYPNDGRAGFVSGVLVSWTEPSPRPTR